jgi:hypothetical protein
MSTNPAFFQYPELTPRVFIGSSSEALDLANRIRDELERGQELEVKVWNKKVLQSGDMLLEGLRRLVSLFDFSILLLTADDIVESKEERGRAPRDNVVFELGMFMGVLGPRRAFPIIVLDPESSLKLPTDIAGLLYTRLDKDKIDDSSYFTEKVAEVREQIKQGSKRATLSLLPSTGLAYGYFNNFLIPVKERLSELSRTRSDKGEETEEAKSIKFIKEIREGKYIFRMLYPRLASKASIDYRDAYVRDQALEPVSVEYKGRRYPFFAYPRRDEEGRIQFADYPTTLRSSSDAIDFVLRESELGEFEEEREQLERKEVTNFIKVLTYLLRRNPAIDEFFRGRIRFQEV